MKSGIWLILMAALVLVGIGLKYKTSPPPSAVALAGALASDQQLRAYVARHGLTKTIDELDAQSAGGHNCHQDAHRVGRLAYEIFGDQAFGTNDYRCFAGSLHGATEAFFQAHGTANLANNVSLACGGAEPSAYRTRECVHGIGHGLMSWNAYQLPKALADCDQLPDPAHQQYCYSGVFMENILASLAKGHQETTYINDELHYPCTAVSDKYKSACYYFQPARMLQLRGQDYQLIVSACASINQAYQSTCFEGLGKETTWLNIDHLPAAVAACQLVSNVQHRTTCFVGGAESLYRDLGQQPRTQGYCQLIPGEPERAACLQFIVARTQELNQ